jgi:NADPH:quinone reductase
LRKNVDLEQGAALLVNPITAWALMDEARRGGHRAQEQTAAASALGRMIVRLGKRFSIPIINVVRRAEQAELLRGLGAEYVVNSSEPEFDKRLHELCHQLGASIGFDAVAGEMSAIVLRAQPRGSRLLVYGALSLQASQAEPGSLIFQGKRLGFWLTAWLRSRTLLGQLRLARQIQELLRSDLKTDFQAKVPLQEAGRALQQYAANMTAGKVLLMP